ncbi:NAD-binding protein [Rhodococcus fascians]|nr:NAD-binding protein [Rhodococcus fascians]MBY4114555.1 NAD-binding protein [Rhodococcus fascians]
MSKVHVGRFLVIGDSNVARHVIALLATAGHNATHSLSPDDKELRTVLRGAYDGIAVVTHDDVLALRYALAIAHSHPETPLVVTVFDQTIASRLRSVLPRSFVTSPAELAAPVLAGSCINEQFFAVLRTREGRWNSVVGSPSGPATIPFDRPHKSWSRRLAVRSSGLLRTPDAGTRMLAAGLAGVLGIIGADLLWLILGKGQPADAALLDAVKVVTTVGPAPDAHGIYAVMSALAMLSTILFTAMVTAGLVDRILGPRLVGLVGSRVLPHSDHVIVVGLGQVGLRLCRELTEHGIDVVGVERNPQAPGLRLARAVGIPAVVVGHGEDRRLLEQVGIRRARAVAVVGSDDLDNIATAVVAQAVAPSVRVILRAGEHRSLTNTKALLPLGVVRDVSALAAAYVAAWVTAREPRAVVSDGYTVWVQAADGQFTESEVSSAKT